MKTWIKVVLGIVLLVLVVALITPLFVNANTFRPRIEKDLSQALNRPVQLGNLSFSLFSGALVADNVTVGDDPKFSASPFLQARSLHIGVQVGPLLFHRQLIVNSFAADQPSVHLLHAGNGTWNFSSLGKTAASRNPGTQGESSIPNLTVGTFDIHNGTVTMENQPSTGRPVTYQNVEINIQQLSLTKQFPFKVTAALPAGGSLSVDGEAGPVSATDASDTPFQANIAVRNFNPVATGVVEATNGFNMVADITAKASSDGRNLSSTGTINANHLQLVKNGTPTPNPVRVTYDIASNLDARTGTIRSLQINTGQIAIPASGTYKLLPTQTNVNVHLSGKGLPIDQLEALLPAVGVRLPPGSRLQGGTLNTELSITGPANAATITGPVNVDNTQLAGFNLGAKLGGLAALGGVQTGNATAIQTFRTNLNASPAGTRTDNLYAALPALGVVTGNGSISPAGALDFKLLVKLSAKQGVSGTALGVLSAFGGTVGKTASTAATNGIPLAITGTEQDPHFSVNVQSLGASALNGQAKGLLGNVTGTKPSGKDLQKVSPQQLLKGLMGAH